MEELAGAEAVRLGLLAPAGTPADIVRKVNADVAKVLARQDVRDQLTEGGQIPGGAPSEQFDKFRREEVAKYAKVIKVAKVPLQ